jgi:hypothetical protein
MIEAFIFVVFVWSMFCLIVSGAGGLLLLGIKIYEWITGRSRQRRLYP